MRTIHSRPSSVTGTTTAAAGRSTIHPYRPNHRTLKNQNRKPASSPPASHPNKPTPQPLTQHGHFTLFARTSAPKCPLDGHFTSLNHLSAPKCPPHGHFTSLNHLAHQNARLTGISPSWLEPAHQNARLTGISPSLSSTPSAPKCPPHGHFTLLTHPAHKMPADGHFTSLNTPLAHQNARLTGISPSSLEPAHQNPR